MIKGTNLKRIIVIDDVGIKQTNSTCTSTFNWSGVVNIANQKDTILLFLGDRMFILIPKRVFANKEELNNRDLAVKSEKSNYYWIPANKKSCKNQVNKSCHCEGGNSLPPKQSGFFIQIIKSCF